MELKELKEQLATANTNGFNRTFMELKVVKKQSRALGVPRFNRTFMELKDPPCRTGRTASPFQSHLYGIESKHMILTRLFYHCFNRTFMELKVTFKLDGDGKGFKFQSHLYGIERRDGFIYNNVCNCFNRTFMELKAMICL